MRIRITYLARKNEKEVMMMMMMMMMMIEKEEEKFLTVADIFFLIFLLKLEIYCQERFQQLSLQTNCTFC